MSTGIARGRAMQSHNSMAQRAAPANISIFRSRGSGRRVLGLVGGSTWKWLKGVGARQKASQLQFARCSNRGNLRKVAPTLLLLFVQQLTAGPAAHPTANLFDCSGLLTCCANWAATSFTRVNRSTSCMYPCLLYTSDAADEEDSV